ncbi:MAG: DUF2971 domain-containing protein [Clostridia bacterium]|nr:DUF2971 domain-containing protein [Clostridia bacterium]
MEKSVEYIEVVEKIIGQNISYLYRLPKVIKNIYHYTNLEGLNGIISNDSFFFTNSTSLNDRSEGKEIFDIIDDVLKNINISNLLDCELKNLTWESLIHSSKLNFYVLSLCKDRDNLTMWNYYTKNNKSLGANLGLDLKELIEKFIYYLDDQIPVRSDNLKWWHTYGSVIYDDEEKYRIIKNIVEATDAELKAGFKEEVLPIFLSILRVLSIFFKNHYFEIENEFRFVIALSTEQLDSYIAKTSKADEKILYKFRSSNGCIQPYLNVPLLKKWKYPHIKTLKEVILSPTFDEDSIYGVRELLDYNEYDMTEIKKSQIPLR